VSAIVDAGGDSVRLGGSGATLVTGVTGTVNIGIATGIFNAGASSETLLPG
jgi:hypothetical protein